MKGHNFKKQEVKSSALYKLWVKYVPRFVANNSPLIKVYYSRDKVKEPDHGYKKLIQMLKGIRHKIQVAILYDNIKNTEIKRFYHEKKD